MKEYIEDLDNLDDEEIRATRVINGLVVGDKVYTEKEMKELEEDVLYWKHQYEEQIKINERLGNKIRKIENYANNIISEESKKRTFKCKMGRIYDGLTTQYKMFAVAKNILELLESE